ncbi:MAG: hypothetical protein QM726_03345 [Chitinophagaceae bacterium]
MKATVCTIFEGEYYYGVATLVNSLYQWGYRGSIYAAYAGVLPTCFSGAKQDEGLSWKGASTLEVTEDLKLHLLPVTTTNHLANYKPDFMLELWQGSLKDAQQLFYFDPDITLAYNWNYLEEWTDCGIALCEDVNSPLGKNHPRRIAWRNYFAPHGFDLVYKESVYANSGFIGVKKEDISFLETWKKIQEAIAGSIGGLNRSPFNGVGLLAEKDRGDYAPFSRTDQDALNAAVEAWQGVVSILGKPGMAFAQGTALIPHAVGAPKPWQWRPLKQALAGFTPRLADREYWKYAGGPLKIETTKKIRRRSTSLKLAGFIGRFYRRAGL